MNADLLGDIDRLFLEAVPVSDALDEWNENVKAGLDRAAVAAEALDHEGALLRDDGGRLGEHDDRQENDDYDNDECFHGWFFFLL